MLSVPSLAFETDVCATTLFEAAAPEYSRWFHYLAQSHSLRFAEGFPLRGIQGVDLRILPRCVHGLITSRSIFRFLVQK